MDNNRITMKKIIFILLLITQVYATTWSTAPNSNNTFDPSVTNGFVPMDYVTNNLMSKVGDITVDGNFTVSEGYAVDLPSAVTKAGNSVPTTLDLQSTFDCVVPDDYDGIASALMAGKSSIFLKSGVYTNTISSKITIDRPIYIVGSGIDSTKMRLKIMVSQNDPDEWGAINIVGGKQFIIRDLSIDVVNGSLSRKNFLYIYNTENGYNFLSERCNFHLIPYGREQIRGVLKTTGNCGKRDITFNRCNIVLDYVDNNSTPGWILDFGSTVTKDSMVTIRDCNYYNNGTTYRDILINAGTLIINGSSFYLTDGKLGDANSYAINSDYFMDLFSFTDNTVIMEGTHDYGALIGLRAANNFVNNCTIVSHNTAPPTRGDFFIVSDNNRKIIISSCILGGIKGFYDYNGSSTTTTNIVTGCLLDYSTAYKVNAQPLEFHNNIINNVYIP